MGTAAALVSASFNGNGIVKRAPKRAHVCFLCVRGRRFKMLQRKDAPISVFCKKRLPVRTVVNKDGIRLKSIGKVRRNQIKGIIFGFNYTCEDAAVIRKADKSAD